MNKYSARIKADQGPGIIYNFEALNPTEALETARAYCTSEHGKAFGYILEGVLLVQPPTGPCEPDIDICSECGEHAGFERDDDGQCVSECCGAAPVSPDQDFDMER